MTLLPFCAYVQWVPGSDVIVAQSHENLCVWYSLDAPERVTIIPIKGEVESIQIINGKTQVRVCARAALPKHNCCGLKSPPPTALV